MTNINTFPGDTQGRNILKSRTITHGVSGSGEVDTYTLNPGENLIILNNHQGSAGSSRSYAANFTAGVPTALGTVLHLEINSSRTNNSSSQVQHRTAIQFGGTAYLDTGTIAVLATGNAKDAYQRKLQRTIVLTVSGWVDFSLGSRIGTVAAATDIIFKTNENVGQAATGSDLADVERMRITSTGNVGIGTNAPGYKIQVEQGVGVNDNGIFISNSNYGSMQGVNISMINAASGNFGSYASIQTYRSGVAASATNLVLCPTAGNVGIGTSSPQGALHVAGSSGSSNTSKALGIHMGVLSGGGESYAHMEIVCNNSNSGWIDFKNANTSGNGDFEERIRGGDGNLVFHTNKGERMRINASGNVGIGSDNPGSTLTVVGDVGITDRMNITKNATYARVMRLGVTSGGTGMGFYMGTGGTNNNYANTGIPLQINNSGGGTILFMFNANHSSGDSTSSQFWVLRKSYSTAWVQDSTNAYLIKHLNGGGGGSMTFRNSSNLLQYRNSGGGNGHFYAIECD